MIMRGAALFLPIALGGCFLPAPYWSSTEWQGPLIEGNKYAAIVERCNMGPTGISDVVHCDRAFVDHNGRKVNVQELRNGIDAYLPNVAPLVPWVKVDRGNKLSPEAPRHGRVPYGLHILTISPLVLLAVPEDNSRRAYCSGHIFKQGCLPTARLMLEPYWWKPSPKVRPGTFWFSPELDVKVAYLTDDQPRHVIAAGASRLELNRQGDTWLVSRR